MTVEPVAYAIQADSHSAQLFRQAISSVLGSAGGTVGSGGLTVSAGGSPAMSVNVRGGTPLEGGIWIPGTTAPGTQGLYFAMNASTTNLSVPAADGTNPRIERVVARIYDAAYAGTKNEFALEVLKGAATAGATLANLSGEAALPASSYTLAHVLVPAGSASVTAGNIANVAQMIQLYPLLQGATRGLASIGTANAGQTLSFINGESRPIYAMGHVSLQSEPKFGCATRMTINGVTVAEPFESEHAAEPETGNKWTVQVPFCFPLLPGETLAVQNVGGGSTHVGVSISWRFM